MALNLTSGTVSLPSGVVIHNGDTLTLNWDEIGTTTGATITLRDVTTTTDWGSTTTWTSTSPGEWMAHPMTADEIIDQAARELARKRPAD